MEKAKSNVLEMVLPAQHSVSLEEEKLELEVESLRLQIQLQELQISSIQPFRFYCTAEIETLLRGHVKLERLRQFGLKGFAQGYWGENVIYALRNYCGMIEPGVAHCAPIKESNNGEIFDNWKLPGQPETERMELRGHRGCGGPSVLPARERNWELVSQSSQLNF